jgi:hypothetical protein
VAFFATIEVGADPDFRAILPRKTGLRGRIHYTEITKFYTLETQHHFEAIYSFHAKPDERRRSPETLQRTAIPRPHHAFCHFSGIQ